MPFPTTHTLNKSLQFKQILFYKVLHCTSFEIGKILEIKINGAAIADYCILLGRGVIHIVIKIKAFFVLWIPVIVFENDVQVDKAAIR